RLTHRTAQAVGHRDQVVARLQHRKDGIGGGCPTLQADGDGSDAPGNLDGNAADVAPDGRGAGHQRGEITLENFYGNRVEAACPIAGYQDIGAGSKLIEYGLCLEGGSSINAEHHLTQAVDRHPHDKAIAGCRSAFVSDTCSQLKQTGVGQTELTAALKAK